PSGRRARDGSNQIGIEEIGCLFLIAWHQVAVTIECDHNARVPHLDRQRLSVYTSAGGIPETSLSGLANVLREER
ncbi:MAG: hypothetical protein ACRDO9_00100, partial [Gaiellales bacterium]